MLKVPAVQLLSSMNCTFYIGLFHFFCPVSCSHWCSGALFITWRWHSEKKNALTLGSQLIALLQLFESPGRPTKISEFFEFHLTVWQPFERCRTAVLPAHCSNSSLFACMLWDATLLQTSNYSLPPPYLSRWTWTEGDGCSFRLFEWLRDFHLIVQTNPNCNPNPTLTLT